MGEEEEEEDEENEAIRAEVRAAEAKNLSHARGDIDAEKVAQELTAVAVSQDDVNSFHVDEEGKPEDDVEEKEEVENIDINADGETVNSEDIVMENGSEDLSEGDNTEGDFNQMPDEKQEDEVSEDKETVQLNQQQTVVSLSNGSANGYKTEALEDDDDSSDESVEDSMIGTTLLDDENLSALRPVSVTRHSSTISNELGILAEEEEEEEEGGGQISFQTQTSNPFDGLEDGMKVEKEEGGTLSKASSKRSVHFDHGEFIFTNGKANGMLESHFGYDDKKNPFMDTFDDS